ncbi:hypothetical protein [Candidatus Palauibacter soopunensis]|uniref:hypothetical protein n=1 Tax=Candidatus Palauibacter soopunensis TaxID=3056739 RepID=UPI00238DEEE9|nr:hypothetical protein [Candidatus Palauibacter soopunensis]MDE2879647.1 hypothetical protein [Candidatus Palauibacter soopunensis]MDE2982020.1 hypothetical protein [Gemmatimonadota bacterium]
MNVAKEIAEALKDAEEYPVRDWDALKIAKEPGIYMFCEGGRQLYVGSATGQAGIEGRLRRQVRPKGIEDYSWTPENPPPKGVRDARNLLFHVLVDDYGRAPKPPWENAEDITALNNAFKRIHGMAVRWVKCPDKDTAIRAEHCAICLLQPEYVAK